VADLSRLPPGATFTADPGDTTGTFAWTPGYADAGSYTVTFTAANALSGSATLLLLVSKVDQAPAVTAPPTATVAEGGTLTVAVQASDVNGDAIDSLTADLSGLPAGHNAVLTPAPGNRSGTLTWTPSYRDAGTYTVT